MIYLLNSDQFFLENLELDGYNEKLNLVIEYNGEQHYKYHEFFHRYDINNLHKQKERDSRKKELCYKNNAYLIIIPYWVVDKEKLIEEYEQYLFFNSFNL